jgi:cytosine/adenosine deaminase-related metal-dependent hydrolase
MLNAGMNVALGLDSQSLDDNVDMFAEMRLLITLLETKGTQLPFHQILCMATTGAAKALSIDTKVGNLNAEMQADVLLIDANKFTYISENPYQDIIQHGAPEKIDFLMIAGQLIIDDGKHFKLERAVLEKSLQQELDTIQDTTTDKALALKPFINALINESSP